MAPKQDNPTRELVGRIWRTHLRSRRLPLLIAMAAMAVGAAATASVAYIVKEVVDRILVEQNTLMLHLIPVAIVVLGLVRGFSELVAQTLLAKVGQGVVAAFQSAMFRHLLGSDASYLAGSRTGTLISRFTNDVNLLRYAFSKSLVGLAKDALTLIFLIGVLFHENWELAAITFVVFPISAAPIVYIGRRVRQISHRSQEGWGDLTATLGQALLGARQIKAYGLEQREAERAEHDIRRIRDLAVKDVRTRARARPILEFLGSSAIALLVYYGGMQVVGGNVSPGTIVAFMTAFILAYQPVRSLANLNATLQAGLAAAQRCFELLDTRPRIVEVPGARPLDVGRGEITFEDVRFSYDDGSPALHGVSLTVPAGATVALVGASGAGKSTILNLIPRFHDVDSGRILIDGQDIRTATLASLRASLALVSQEVFLLDDTVFANIACGRPGADRDEIIEAARNAGAHGFIEGLPEGYGTRIGELGIRLSGGQRQRLAMARAMVRNAPILLLDEATSSLDTEAERQVQAGLHRLTQGRTTLVIAHRLSTVANADLIHVMDRGRVVEAGAHGTLLKRGGIYARLHALQFAAADRNVA